MNTPQSTLHVYRMSHDYHDNYIVAVYYHAPRRVAIDYVSRSILRVWPLHPWGCS